MAKSCSCGGANPNCSRCFGSGELANTHTSLPPLSVERRKVLAARTPRLISPGSPAAFSLSKGMGALADANINGSHRSKTKPAKQPRIVPQQQVLLRCVLCNVLGMTDFHVLEAHLSNHHRVAPIPLKQMMKKTRKKANKDHPQAIIGSKVAHHRLSNNLEMRPNVRERSESSLDGTKDYGFPSREEGRYGSSPSHDSYGDESTS
jgi:hypothetical protein